MTSELRARKRRKTGAELLGALAGFLSAADPELEIEVAFRVENREVDLLLRKSGLVAPLEIKRGGSGYFLDAASEQVKTLATLLHSKIGFVFMPPRDSDAAINAAQVRFAEEGIDVAIVAPMPYLEAEPDVRSNSTLQPRQPAPRET